MPIGGDAVERAETTTTKAAVHGGIAPAQTLTNLWQPIAIRRLVVLVGIDGVVDLLAGQAAGVNDVAVGRLEVDALDEVAVNDAATAEINGAAKERDLSARRLHRKCEAN